MIFIFLYFVLFKVSSTHEPLNLKSLKLFRHPQEVNLSQDVYLNLLSGCLMRIIRLFHHIGTEELSPIAIHHFSHCTTQKKISTPLILQLRPSLFSCSCVTVNLTDVKFCQTVTKGCAHLSILQLIIHFKYST